MTISDESTRRSVRRRLLGYDYYGCVVAVLNPDAVIDAEDETAAVIRHDARNLPLDDESVDLIVTSPPYFALRSYRDDGEHYDGQIGSEDTPDQWLDALDECMVEWGRVLKPSGSVWINLGDKYANQPPTGTAVGGKQRGHHATCSDCTKASGRWVFCDRHTASKADLPQLDTRKWAREKSLMGLPWRFAIRQIDAGWILRAEVIWDKPNGLPESVTDRVRRSHETWFHMTKEPRYFSGVDEIREPHATIDRPGDRSSYSPGSASGSIAANGDHETKSDVGLPLNPLGRLPGSVWRIPSEPLLIPDDIRKLLDLPDHFAAFPQEWPRRIILGWSSTGICTECGEGRSPVVEKTLHELHRQNRNRAPRQDLDDDGFRKDGGFAGASDSLVAETTATITGYTCACPTLDAPTTPSIVLDPMGGTGTVAGVARTLGRYGISNDLSADYNKLAQWRIWNSGHFTKTEQRTWQDRQGSLL